MTFDSVGSTRGGGEKSIPFSKFESIDFVDLFVLAPVSLVILRFAFKKIHSNVHLAEICFSAGSFKLMKLKLVSYITIEYADSSDSQAVGNTQMNCNRCLHF